MVMASSWSWVTWMKVSPTSVWIRLISICIERRSLRSRAPSGSSSSSTSGLLISARASATRCCWPPESWAGFLRAWLPSSTRSSISRTCGVDVRLLAAAQPEGDVLVDVEVREQRVALEDRVDRPLVGLGVGDVLAGQRDRARRSASPARPPSAAWWSCRSRTGRAARRTSRAVRRGRGRGRRRTAPKCLVSLRSASPSYDDASAGCRRSGGCASATCDIGELSFVLGGLRPRRAA